MEKKEWLSADAEKNLKALKVRLYAAYGRNHSDRDILKFLLEDISSKPDASRYMDDMINYSIYGELEL